MKSTLSDGPHPAYIRMEAELKESRGQLQNADVEFLIAASNWVAVRTGHVENIFLLKVALGLPIHCPKVEKKKMNKLRQAARKLNVSFIIPILSDALEKSKKQQARLGKVLKIPQKLLKRRRGK